MTVNLCITMYLADMEYIMKGQDTRPTGIYQGIYD